MASWEFPIGSKPRAAGTEPIVMLGEAQLCQDCTAISAARGGSCGRCGSKALLALHPVLNRGDE